MKRILKFLKSFFDWEEDDWKAYEEEEREIEHHRRLGKLFQDQGCEYHKSEDTGKTTHMVAYTYHRRGVVFAANIHTTKEDGSYAKLVVKLWDVNKVRLALRVQNYIKEVRKEG